MDLFTIMVLSNHTCHDNDVVAKIGDDIENTEIGITITLIKVVLLGSYCCCSICTISISIPTTIAALSTENFSLIIKDEILLPCRTTNITGIIIKSSTNSSKYLPNSA